MSADALLGDVSERLRWVIREAIVIAVLLLFAMVVGLALAVLFRFLGFVLFSLGFERVQSLYHLTHPAGDVWAVVTPLAGGTLSLYVLARVGTILIDQYQSPAAN